MLLEMIATSAPALPIWLQAVAALAPVAALVAATITLLVGYHTIKQRALADRRDQYWKRLEWAVGLVLARGDFQKQRLGLSVLQVLADETWTTDDEVGFFDAITEPILDYALAERAGPPIENPETIE